MSLFSDAMSGLKSYVTGTSSPTAKIAADATKITSTSGSTLFQKAMDGFLKSAASYKPPVVVKSSSPAAPMQMPSMMAGIGLPVIVAGVALIWFLRR
jgi:hypothetical protein